MQSQFCAFYQRFLFSSQTIRWSRLASPQRMRASKSTCLFGRAPSASKNVLSAQAIEIWVKLMKSSVDGYSLLNASASISSQASNMNQERRWTFYIVYQMKRRSWGQTPYVFLSTFAIQQSMTCFKKQSHAGKRWAGGDQTSKFIANLRSKHQNYLLCDWNVQPFQMALCFINIKDKITATRLLRYVTCLTSPAKSDCFAALSLLSYGGVFVHWEK